MTYLLFEFVMPGVVHGAILKDFNLLIQETIFKIPTKRGKVEFVKN